MGLDTFVIELGMFALEFVIIKLGAEYQLSLQSESFLPWRMSIRQLKVTDVCVTSSLTS